MRRGIIPPDAGGQGFKISIAYGPNPVQCPESAFYSGDIGMKNHRHAHNVRTAPPAFLFFLPRQPGRYLFDRANARSWI